MITMGHQVNLKLNGEHMTCKETTPQIVHVIMCDICNMSFWTYQGSFALTKEVSQRGYNKFAGTSYITLAMRAYI